MANVLKYVLSSFRRALFLGVLNLVDLAGSERLSRTGATVGRAINGSKRPSIHLPTRVFLVNAIATCPTF